MEVERKKVMCNTVRHSAIKTPSLFQSVDRRRSGTLFLLPKVNRGDEVGEMIGNAGQKELHTIVTILNLKLIIFF